MIKRKSVFKTQFKITFWLINTWSDLNTASSLVVDPVTNAYEILQNHIHDRRFVFLNTFFLLLKKIVRTYAHDNGNSM